MKLDREELHRKLQQDIAQSKALIATLMQEEMLDEDGYPTLEALEIVEKWHWFDAKGWFEFIKTIWWYPNWGWKEKEEPHEYRKDKNAYRYYLSTGGWSGNEAIIAAMQRNSMMWNLNWVQSRRGGHYIFELYTFEDDEREADTESNWIEP